MSRNKRISTISLAVLLGLGTTMTGVAETEGATGEIFVVSEEAIETSGNAADFGEQETAVTENAQMEVYSSGAQENTPFLESVEMMPEETSVQTEQMDAAPKETSSQTDAAMEETSPQKEQAEMASAESDAVTKEDSIQSEQQTETPSAGSQGKTEDSDQDTKETDEEDLLITETKAHDGKETRAEW